MDYILNAAKERNILVAMSALWIRPGGADTEGWRYQLTSGRAKPYGQFLGRRYQGFDNLIWILGGDANPIELTRAVDEMAKGIQEFAPRQLITVHNRSDFASSAFFESAAWLGINMAYTYGETYIHTLGEWNRIGRPRPIVLGESGYEEESNDRRGGEPLRMRRQAYGAILAGALGGHAFGQKHIWRFDDEWRKSLESPATKQMVYLKELFTSRAWYGLRPDQFVELVVGERALFGRADSAIAARAEDKSFALVYLPTNRAITIDLEMLKRPVVAKWFDPTDGSYKMIQDVAQSGRQQFTPPPQNASGDTDFPSRHRNKKDLTSVDTPSRLTAWCTRFRIMNKLGAVEYLSFDDSTERPVSVLRISQYLARLARMCALLLILCGFSVPAADAASRLKVSPNKRFLTNEDGTPFFYLADTAWYLIPRLTREEIDYYLDNRKSKGFTVIQADVFRASDLRSGDRTNRSGQRPLHNNDLSQPNETYFRHVDYVVRQAEAKGLFVALLPVWGDMVTRDYFDGVVNSFLDASKAEAYGKYIGARYRNDANIIWVLGGDRSPTSAQSRTVWRALAKGIAVGVSGGEDYGKVLMTFHPAGPDRGAKYFHQDAWLDFNMFQSGHFSFDIHNDDFASDDYALTPPKPTLDGESRYEDHPVGNKIETGRFDAFDMRQAAYWSLLAGACGHTYGDHNVWQMYTPERRSIAGGRIHWRQALDHPGAVQMGLVRKLFESRPFQKLVPDQSIISGSHGQGTARIRAARAEDGSFLFVYVPVGQPVAINLEKIAGGQCQAWWYNPRDGKVEKIGQFPNVGTKEFLPPNVGRGYDWVIVIDSSAQTFPPPGG